jgi:hypothetical protein
VFNGSSLPSRLYEDLCFVPRSYVAGNSMFSTNSLQTLDRLASLDFDALNTVILAAPAERNVAQDPLSGPAVFPPHRDADKPETIPPATWTSPAPPEAPQGRKAGPALRAVDGPHPPVVIPAKAGTQGSQPGLAPRPSASAGQTSHGRNDTATGQVEIVRREPNSVTLRAELTCPSYVVLLERYDPSWQATIDGRPATVLRANQVFRAVYAEAGRHEIRFDYRQRGLRAGAVISLLTLATLIVLSLGGAEI